MSTLICQYESAAEVEPRVHANFTRPNRLDAAVAAATLAAIGLALAAPWPRWAAMWGVGFAIFAALKYVVVRRLLASKTQFGLGRWLAWFCAWPGLRAEPFFANRENLKPRTPAPTEWLAAAFKVALGVAAVWLVAPLANADLPTTTAIAGMFALVLLLHSGLFHVVALVWQTRGLAVEPITRKPMLATSLADFWGRRWNLAFRDFAHAFVFRPLVEKLGAAGATLAVFAFSGIVHDLVISLPSRGGYGLPTLYFLLHGVAQLFERSALGRRFGLGRGLVGRVYAWLWVIVPLPLLFHAPFGREVIGPMLKWLTCT